MNVEIHKLYTVMPNNIAKLLNSADTYRYVALSFTDFKKTGKTDATFKQIGDTIIPYKGKDKGESPRTVEKFISRLKNTKKEDGTPLLYIDSTMRDDKGNRRNIYHFENVNEDFRMVKKEFMYLDLDVKLKGFMLQLLSITINGTLQVKYSLAKISREINISRPTATKYMDELIKLGFVKEIEGGYELINEYFKLGKTKKEKEIEEIKKIADTNNYLKEAFDKIKWEDIASPKMYWEASVIMRLRGTAKLYDTNNNTTIIL